MLRPAEFVVETVEAGLGEVLVYIEDPEGHTEEVRVKRHSEYIHKTSEKMFSIS